MGLHDRRPLAEPRTLAFGDVRARAAGFVLAATYPAVPDDSFDFLVGGSFVVLDGRRWDLLGQNGIEAMAVANLRADLRMMIAERSGGLCARDHDGSLLVNLWIEGTSVLAFATAPGAGPWSPGMGEGLWDEPLTSMSIDDLAAMVGLIDEVEEVAGPLAGYCCGIPPLTWPSYDPRRDL